MTKESANLKRRATCLRKYGTECVSNVPEIRKKVERSLGNSYIEYHWKTDIEIVCRCSYELFFVRLLNELKVDFDWQIPIILDNGTVYWVDSYLPELDIWIEVKGCWWPKGKEKWELFHEKHPNSIVLFKKNLHDLGYSQKILFTACPASFQDRMCIWYKKNISFIGRKYGLLTIDRPANDAHLNGDRVDYKWVTICDCGNEFVVRHSSLLTNNTRSCGCLFDAHLEKIHKQISRPVRKWDELNEKYLYWPSLIGAARDTGKLLDWVKYWVKHELHGWSYDNSSDNREKAKS